MTPRRPDKLDPRSYEARKRSPNPQVMISMRRETLERLDELRGSIPRGTMIAMLIEYWDSKPRRRKK